MIPQISQCAHTTGSWMKLIKYSFPERRPFSKPLRWSLASKASPSSVAWVLYLFPLHSLWFYASYTGKSYPESCPILDRMFQGAGAQSDGLCIRWSGVDGYLLRFSWSQRYNPCSIQMSCSQHVNSTLAIHSWMLGHVDITHCTNCSSWIIPWRKILQTFPSFGSPTQALPWVWIANDKGGGDWERFH